MRLELPSLLRGRGTTVVYVTQDYKEAMALADNIVVLTEGSVTQHGTPADIYLQPATIEIARLFGDPVINLFDVTPRVNGQGVCIDLSGGELQIQGATEQLQGRDCVLGIRPEYVSFVPPGTPGSMVVGIEAETPINEKVITLATTTGGRELLVSRPAGSPGPDPEGAYVELKHGSVLLFDKATGELLAGFDNVSAAGAAA